MMRAMTHRPSDGRTKSAIGNRLELTRRALGLAQGDFASRAGIARNAYNQYETGTNRPQLDAAFKLCDTYRLTLDWIYFGDASGLRFDLAEAIKAMRKVAD
jgi:transcriptional regulator with XRE-family HTH domain